MSQDLPVSCGFSRLSQFYRCPLFLKVLRNTGKDFTWCPISLAHFSWAWGYEFLRGRWQRQRTILVTLYHSLTGLCVVNILTADLHLDHLAKTAFPRSLFLSDTYTDPSREFATHCCYLGWFVSLALTTMPGYII